MLRFRKTFALVALALFLGGTGCGTMPTAPSPFASSAATSSVDATAGSTSTSAISTGTNGLVSSIGSLFGSLVGLVVRVLDVVGSLGGSLSNGRWRVDVPPNAIQGNATVAIGVRNSTSADCHLEISPAEANHFDVPVQVTVDCRSVPNDELATYAIFWFNPTTGRWVPVEGSRVDLTRKTVSAPLQHFSQYAVGPTSGKGGW